MGPEATSGSRIHEISALAMKASVKKSTAPRILIATGDDQGDARWLTGFAAPDPYGVIAEANGPVHLFVSHLEALRARRAAKPGVEVHVYEKSLSGTLAEWLKNRGFRHACGGPALPFGTVRTLEDAGIVVRLLRGEEAAFSGRLVKDEAELRFICIAQHAATAAVRRARQILRESVPSPAGILVWKGKTLTSERLRDEMETVIRARGCASDDGLIAAGGRQAACPHESGHGPLRTGDAIVLDVFPRHQASGYWGDLTRTLMKGRPRDPRILAMYKAVLATQQLIFSRIRPGITGASLHQLALDSLAEKGFPLDTTPGHEKGMFHGLGHGVGLAIHEEPRLSPSGKNVLEDGNVVTVEPGVYYPEWGGVRIEDTVAITPDGIDNLATAPKFLEIP